MTSDLSELGRWDSAAASSGSLQHSKLGEIAI